MSEPDYSIPDVPTGLVAVPQLSAAAEIGRANRELRSGWRFAVGDQSAREFAAAMRASAGRVAGSYCRERSIPFDVRSDTLIVTGHQPLLFHPGVWVKNFTVDGLARRLGGTALNLVVDSDAASDAGLDVPSWDGDKLKMVRRRMVDGAASEMPFETIGPPSGADLSRLVTAVAEDLATLEDPSPSHRFSEFARLLLGVDRAGNLGDLLTQARRAYESAAGTAYGELPVGGLCGTREFLTFFLSIAERIEEFCEIYNTSLGEYRAARDIRSPANPFPELATDGDLIETPFWLMDGKGLRATLWLKRKGELSLMCHADGCRVELVRGRYSDNIGVLGREGIQIRPKALVLTLFVRMFVADLFVHGVGGAKYDRVTDEIIRRFYGADPPDYFAVTATMWLPTGVEARGGDSLSDLRQRLHALEHNPDRFAGDPALPADARPRIAELTARKAVLVEQIGRQGADKKELGGRIRLINSHLAKLLDPLRARTRENIRAAERAEASRQVARHRDFPYCYWSALDVRSLVDRALSAAELQTKG